mmetsp:Transcript_36231/g.111628  ORF Transcript_36231/g.111628 Transcript_36231/m.111628 type:complete len:313 (-) Transcript_36231:477-1415(-)
MPRVACDVKGRVELAPCENEMTLTPGGVAAQVRRGLRLVAAWGQRAEVRQVRRQIREGGAALRREGRAICVGRSGPRGTLLLQAVHPFLVVLVVVEVQALVRRLHLLVALFPQRARERDLLDRAQRGEHFELFVHVGGGDDARVVVDPGGGHDRRAAHRRAVADEELFRRRTEDADGREAVGEADRRAIRVGDAAHLRPLLQVRAVVQRRGARLRLGVRTAPHRDQVVRGERRHLALPRRAEADRGSDELLLQVRRDVVRLPCRPAEVQTEVPHDHGAVLRLVGVAVLGLVRDRRERVRARHASGGAVQLRA